MAKEREPKKDPIPDNLICEYFVFWLERLTGVVLTEQERLETLELLKKCMFLYSE